MRDMETQLKQQQNLYSAVRNDRTGLAKSLTEAQDEISDLKVTRSGAKIRKTWLHDKNELAEWGRYHEIAIN